MKHATHHAVMMPSPSTHAQFPIRLTDECFQEITSNGLFCEPHPEMAPGDSGASMSCDYHHSGELSREGFQKMIRSEMRNLSRRNLFQAMKWNRNAESLETLMVLKSILTEIEQIEMECRSKDDRNSGLKTICDLKEKVIVGIYVFCQAFVRVPLFVTSCINRHESCT